jgi:hypothetical protein
MITRIIFKEDIKLSFNDLTKIINKINKEIISIKNDYLSTLTNLHDSFIQKNSSKTYS